MSIQTKKEEDDLVHSSYWDRYYEFAPIGEEPVHEWIGSMESLKPFLEANMFGQWPPETNPSIIHLGAGDSTIPRDLAVIGYSNQLCVDFSEVVVKQMSQKHAEFPGIRWQCMDCLHMDDLSSESIDIAFDKSTLDAMIYGSPWNPPDDVIQRTSAFIKEISRVLKDDGVWLCVSFRPSHFLRPLLNCDGVDWDIEVAPINGSSGLPIFGWVLKKRAPAT